MEFQAEIKRILDLMINSLYTNKEIFLRELISNASDALDRLRFETLTRPELMSEYEKLEIRLEVDREARTLTVSDNGIGMSRAEVIENIGTIAKSGTRELHRQIVSGAPGERISELIGQFGVGFYSSFMVADRVSLTTRRAGEETATFWESTGDGTYSVASVEKEKPGSTVVLHLKDVDLENGVEDYTDKWILARIIKRYSDFVSYPIIFKDERNKSGENLETVAENAANEITIEEKVLNSMKPIWTRPQSEVSPDEYAEFYKHFTHDLQEPLETVPLKAEGVLEYLALLFIPSQAPYDLYYHAAESGLRLYSKGVMVIENCDSLLPRYLRFVKGLVDSSDLPLNISRQMLQQDRHLRQISKWLTKKLLDVFETLKDRRPEKYLQFWRQFGRALKEGTSGDYPNRDKIASLLLFSSSHDAEKLTTLKEYIARMKPSQEDIYFLTGESRKIVENSPHLEAFLAKGYEVLYLTDPVDELLVQSVMEYEGKKLVSVRKGVVKIGDDEEKKEAELELKAKTEAAAELLQHIQNHLNEYVKEVRLTNRLTLSPVCLVGGDLDYSPQLERLLNTGNGRSSRRILEINPEHEIFNQLQKHFVLGGEKNLIGELSEVLFGSALLAEGADLPNPVRFNQLVSGLLLNQLAIQN
jgi:molecular chaperone HtpG